jgi:acetyl-CoA carboxylase biotin carboxyl carrier protein
MKLMNEIEAEYDGIVEKVLAKNAQPLEYGQPIFVITPA